MVHSTAALYADIELHYLTVTIYHQICSKTPGGEKKEYSHLTLHVFFSFPQVFFLSQKKQNIWLNITSVHFSLQKSLYAASPPEKVSHSFVAGY